jgi:hypothetical protein
MTPWLGKKGVVKGLALNLANTKAPPWYLNDIKTMPYIQSQ